MNSRGGLLLILVLIANLAMQAAMVACHLGSEHHQGDRGDIEGALHLHERSHRHGHAHGHGRQLSLSADPEWHPALEHRLPVSLRPETWASFGEVRSRREPFVGGAAPVATRPGRRLDNESGPPPRSVVVGPRLLRGPPVS